MPPKSPSTSIACLGSQNDFELRRLEAEEADLQLELQDLARMRAALFIIINGAQVAFAHEPDMVLAICAIFYGMVGCVALGSVHLKGVGQQEKLEGVRRRMIAESRLKLAQPNLPEEG